MTNASSKLEPINSDNDWADQGWSEDPSRIRVAGTLSTAISIRLDERQAKIVRRAARLKGKTLSGFIRHATITEADRVCSEADTAPVKILHANITRKASTFGELSTRLEAYTAPTVAEGRQLQPV